MMRNEFHKRRRELARLLILGACAVVCVVVLTAITTRLKQTTQAQTRAEMRFKPQLVVQTGHSEQIRKISFSTDGKLMASFDSQMGKLWDVETGKELSTLGTPFFSSDLISTSKIFSGNVLIESVSGEVLKKFETDLPTGVFSISADNQTVATVSENFVQFWSYESGEKINIFKSEKATLSPDGKIFATIGNIENIDKEQEQSYSKIFVGNTRLSQTKSQNDDFIHIWSAGSGKEIVKLRNSTKPELMFFNNNETQLIAIDNSTLNVWNLAGGKLLKTLKVNFDDYSLDSVLFNASAKAILFPYETGNKLLNYETDKIWSISNGLSAFSPNGKILAIVAKGIRETSSSKLTPAQRGKNETVTEKTSIELWSTENNQKIKTFDINNISLNDYGSSKPVFSPDGKLLAVGDSSKIHLFELSTGQEITTFEGYSNKIQNTVLGQDGKTISASTDNKTMIWSLTENGSPSVIDGSQVYSIVTHFSPWSVPTQIQENKTIITRNSKGSILIWDAETGKNLNELTLDFQSKSDFLLQDFNLGQISPNLSLIAQFEEHNINLFNLIAGKTNWKSELKDKISSVNFSNDGKTLDIKSNFSKVNLLNVSTGESYSTEGSEDWYTGKIISNGKILSVCNNTDSCNFYEVSGKQLIKKYSISDSEIIIFTSITSDGRFYVSHQRNGNDYTKVEIREILTGKLVKTFPLSEFNPSDSFLTTDGKTLLVYGSENIQAWNVVTGKIIWERPMKFEYDSNVDVNSDNTVLATIGKDGNTIDLWKINTGDLIKTLKLDTTKDRLSIRSIAFSPTDKNLLVSDDHTQIKIWDCQSEKELRTIPWVEGGLRDPVRFSNDGKTLIGINYSEISIWNVETGDLLESKQKELNSLIGKNQLVDFNFNSNLLLTSQEMSSILTVDAVSGKKIKEKKIPIFDNEKILVKVGDINVKAFTDPSSIKLINSNTEKEVANLYWFNDTDWVVLDSEGRFDASEGAMNYMHFVVSDEQIGHEIISLEQLKTRYYVPGLLQKIFKTEQLPPVGEFAVTLYPKVEIGQAKTESSTLNLKLENRGGGIGRVEVYLNGSELTNDARQGKSVDKNAATVNLPVEIPADKLNAGANKIEIVTWNTEGDVRSRSKEVYLEKSGNQIAVRGTEIVNLAEEKQTYSGHFYAIVAGISDYANDAMDLRFAAKDAEDMSKALALGGRRLFCSNEMDVKKPCERVHLRLLSTEKETTFSAADIPDQKRFAPTKGNFQAVFNEIAAKAKPEDVVVIYLAGHGTAIKSAEAMQESAFPDLYIYPTMDATTLDKVALGNKDVRERTTISSLEMADWVNQIKANKKAMIFDTCASGTLENSDLTKARADDALQIRALDRLRERTGFYVLMGSAADAVSYEASSFRQGLLTYSLLAAMKGEKLRDDKYVDVEDWFKYAENKVEDLAKGIGGIQRPRYFKSNFNTQSFDVGRFETAEQKDVPLARPVPLILQPELREEGRRTDKERLTEKLEVKLNEASFVTTRGAGAAINYVKATNAANGLSPRGSYTISSDGKITVEIALVRDEEEIAKVRVEGTRENIIGKLVQAVTSAAQGK